MSESTILWELMEMEAVERYYLDRPKEGFRAEKPGILITTAMFRAPDAKNQEHFTVWFGLHHKFDQLFPYVDDMRFLSEGSFRKRKFCEA